MKMNKTLITGLTTLGLATLSQAAVIVTNNTGHATSSIVVIDNIAATNNVRGTNGTDGDANAFGQDGLWSNGGDVTYNFTGLTAGTYTIYATFYGNGDTSGTGFAANGTSLGSVPTLSGPDASAGFTAYDEVNDDASEPRSFQLIGTATIAGSTLDLVLTPAGANGFGRYDAVALSSVPEPSSAALIGLGGLALILRRRK